MTKTLRLAEDLVLPADAATQTFLIVGKRGSGKTNTAGRLAEQFHHAGVPFVVLDPVDGWWGLKSSANGKSPGLPAYVFGGRHGDLPLEPGAGALMADVAVEHRTPLVLSIKHFGVRERRRFVADFATRLFHKNTEPLHVFLEEAHEVAPQQFKGDEEMLGAVQRLVKLGRSSGLGVSAITQRPASLNKNVTTQAEILIVHRTIGPQDVAAIKEWIRYHGEREEVLAELPGLRTGEARVWAPDFPENRPLGLLRTHILMRETFDSASTPKTGERRTEPKALAHADLERLRERMAGTIERAKAEDPRELKKQLAAVQAELRKAQTAKPAPPPAAPKVERREVPVLKDSQIKRLEAFAERLAGCGESLRVVAGEVLAEARKADAASKLAPPLPTPRSVLAAPAPRPSRGAPAGTLPAHRPSPAAADVDGRVTPARQRILDALAALESIGIRQANRTQLALFAKASPTSSSYTNNLGALRTAGLLDYPAQNFVALTADGRAIADPGQVPTTKQEVWAFVQKLLPPARWRIVEALIGAYPEAMERGQLAEAADASATSSSFTNNLGGLRSLGLLDYPAQGLVKASAVLFPGVR